MTSSTTVSSPPKSPRSEQRPSLPTEIRVDRTAKRIRVFFAGKLLGDSVSARLGYSTGRHPEYLIPVVDIDWANVAVDDGELVESPLGSYSAIRHELGGREIGRRHSNGLGAGFASFDFDSMDAWFEEDEQIWFHARDPFRRVEVIESSRLVEVNVNGREVARSRSPRLVTETGLPERWYIPRIDVDWTQLRPSETSSGCQYKGVANWWHVCHDGYDQLADVVWGYERPVPESSKLAGLVSFFAEHAAVETFVDSVIQPRPVVDRTAISPSLNLVNMVVQISQLDCNAHSEMERVSIPLDSGR
jgi:uncharacterized protein (DUF427 family)